MLTPTRYKFQNEEVLVDPRDGGNRVVGTIPNTPTRYTAPATPQPDKTVYQPTPVQTPPTGQNFAPQSLLTADQFALQRNGGVDEAAIREQTRKNMQSQIDATNAYYADLIGREQQAGEERNAKVQALNVNSGLSGSNFATSADLKQKSLNQQAVKGIEAERNMQIQGVLGKIDEIARGEIQAKKAEALGNAEAYTKYLADAKAETVNQLKQMAGANIDLTTIPEAQRKYLLNRAYGDEAMGEVIYNSLKPKATQIDYKFEKLADGEGLFYGVDPSTGQLKQQRVSVDVPAGFDLTIAPDGTPILFNKKTGQAQIAGGFGEGQFAKPVEPEQLYGGLTKEQRSELQRVQGNVRQDPDIKDFITIRDGFERVQEGANRDDSQGDLALLFGYMKLLDPNSVVRETEFANAEQAQGTLQRVMNIPDKFIRGTRLTAEGRKHFAEAAKDLYARKEKQYQKAYDFYGNQLDEYNIPREMGLRDFTTSFKDETVDSREAELRQQFPDATDEEIREVLGFKGSATGSSTNKVGANNLKDRNLAYAPEISPVSVKIGAGAGVKNNNPGNLRNTDGSWMQFKTPEEGFKALMGYIQRAKQGDHKRYNSNQSLYDYFAVYAPASDNNKPRSYAESVAKRLGISPTTKIGQIDTFAFAKEIARHESSTIINNYA